MKEHDMIKQRIEAAVEEKREEILAISHAIHENPELGMEEFFAVERLVGALGELGFTAAAGSGGIATAFRADFDSRKPGPRVALLAEYDALQGLGHACGHNIIAAAAYGAAAGLKAVIDETGGSVTVIGTPAEEDKGGKIILLEAGVFDDCDFVMMIHPCAGKGVLAKGALACTEVFFDYHGKPAHSSEAEKGINALSACIETFNRAAQMQTSLKEGQMFNGVILHGGEANNVVPGYAQASFCIRGATLEDLTEVTEKLICCAEEASRSIGTWLKVTRAVVFSHFESCRAMDELFAANMDRLGVKMEYAREGETGVSTDAGNVSLVKPTIHEYISVTEEDLNLHTEEFRKVCRGEGGDRACIDGAKALAMTGADILLRKGKL